MPSLEVTHTEAIVFSGLNLHGRLLNDLANTRQLNLAVVAEVREDYSLALNARDRNEVDVGFLLCSLRHCTLVRRLGNDQGSQTLL